MANKMTWDGKQPASTPHHNRVPFNPSPKPHLTFPPSSTPLFPLHHHDPLNPDTPPIGAADQHLLLSILTTHDIKIDFDLVATHLGCSPRAVQERLKKLRKMASDSAATTAVVAPTTPTKTKTKSPTTAKTKTPTKTKGAPGGADAAVPSPKKRKIATPKAKGGKAGLAVAAAGPGADGEDDEVKVKVEMVGEEEMEEGPGGPEMSAVVKEEDLLGTDHDSVLYDARVGVPAGEI